MMDDMKDNYHHY